jgi:hypothetical protein
LQHIVEDEEATGAQAADQLLVVERVAGLVGVDEREVEDRLGGQRPQGGERRGDPQVDPFLKAGPLPVAPGDRGPLLPARSAW